jgi:hypothetical protein
MTEQSKEGAAKPQSDRDGGIIPVDFTSFATDKVFATLWSIRKKL